MRTRLLLLPLVLAMAFCTAADVEATYDARPLAQLTGDPAGVQVDAEALDVAVDAFATVIAPYVRERYGDTDFGVAEPTLNAMNVEGAYLELQKRKALGLSAEQRQDYAHLLSRLRDVAAGRMSLVMPGDADAQDPAAELSAEGQFWAPQRQFGRALREPTSYARTADRRPLRA